MGVIAAPSKILVTGANGYVAMWIISLLLNAGYSVRGTIRKLEKSKDLATRFSKFAETGKLEFTVIEDITIDGAFDDAVKDVDGIIHTASPITIKVDLPEEVIKPAVAGIHGVLKSSLQFGNRLNRIIFTSATATIFAPVTEPTVRDETDWNNFAVEVVEKLGREARPMSKYMTSKIFGPALNSFKTPSEQNESTRIWWDNVIANPATPESASFAANWVDVRDLGHAFILALQKPDAGGERLIISAGTYTWQDWIDVASTHRSPLRTHEFSHHKGLGDYLPKGCPEIEGKYLLVYSNAKAHRRLGPELR